jgi:hypothetical protein
MRHEMTPEGHLAEGRSERRKKAMGGAMVFFSGEKQTENDDKS